MTLNSFCSKSLHDSNMYSEHGVASQRFQFRPVLVEKSLAPSQLKSKSFRPKPRLACHRACSALTSRRDPPNMRQKTSGPARSVSCMMAASGVFIGFSTDSV